VVLNGEKLWDRNLLPNALQQKLQKRPKTGRLGSAKPRMKIVNRDDHYEFLG
jgi:hypothetical protein